MSVISDFMRFNEMSRWKMQRHFLGCVTFRVTEVRSLRWLNWMYVLFFHLWWPAVAQLQYVYACYIYGRLFKAYLKIFYVCALSAAVTLTHCFHAPLRNSVFYLRDCFFDMTQGERRTDLKSGDMVWGLCISLFTFVHSYVSLARYFNFQVLQAGR